MTSAARSAISPSSTLHRSGSRGVCGRSHTFVHPQRAQSLRFPPCLCCSLGDDYETALATLSAPTLRPLRARPSVSPHPVRRPRRQRCPATAPRRSAEDERQKMVVGRHPVAVSCQGRDSGASHWASANHAPVSAVPSWPVRSFSFRSVLTRRSRRLHGSWHASISAPASESLGAAPRRPLVPRAPTVAPFRGLDRQIGSWVIGSSGHRVSGHRVIGQSRLAPQSRLRAWASPARRGSIYTEDQTGPCDRRAPAVEHADRPHQEAATGSCTAHDPYPSERGKCPTTTRESIRRVTEQVTAPEVRTSSRVMTSHHNAQVTTRPSPLREAQGAGPRCAHQRPEGHLLTTRALRQRPRQRPHPERPPSRRPRLSARTSAVCGALGARSSPSCGRQTLRVAARSE